jgi:hypothetical protein
MAARRSAAATQLAERFVRPLSFWPPETLLPGERLSQEAKCFSVGHRLMSNPISATTLRGRGRVDAIDPGEIDAREAMEVLAVRRTFRGRGAADRGWPPLLSSNRVSCDSIS